MRFLSFLFMFMCFATCKAQDQVSKLTTTLQNTVNEHPKLVVGIVVDQMRYDYLTRFEKRYGAGGFNRMIKKGFNCKNNHFNYVPTYTGPGHASVYTGTTPKYHGVISNNWYDKTLKKTVYCAGDDSVSSVGTTHNAGKMSPHRMRSTTFADENRLFTQQKGKSIGIAIKDRGAILPAGHSANAAYWFHGKDEGHWISSSYYMNALPQWVKKFNASNTAESYLKEWNTLYDISTYTESGPDLNEFEGGFRGKETAAFPYDLAVLKLDNSGFDILKATAYGNSLTTDFAIAAIKGEQLGKDAHTDVLTVSYSSTDYVGHNFGVNSKEIEDTYLRLDKDIERLLNELDAYVGSGKYTVFLTADHGAVNVPAFLHKENIPAGYLDNKSMKNRLKAYLVKKYGASDIVENVSNNQIFLNKKKLDLLNLDVREIQEVIVDELMNFPNIDKAYSAATMTSASFTTGIESLLQNGFNQKRSGDVLVVHIPAFISYGKTGSTHGSGFNYDTHVPLIFFGHGVKQGATLQKTVIPDIAPTISALLGISFPNASTGNVLEFVMD